MTVAIPSLFRSRSFDRRLRPIPMRSKASLSVILFYYHALEHLRTVIKLNNAFTLDALERLETGWGRRSKERRRRSKERRRNRDGMVMVMVMEQKTLYPLI